MADYRGSPRFRSKNRKRFLHPVGEQSVKGIHEIVLRFREVFALRMDAWNLLDVGVKTDFVTWLEYRG
jgi:hypothetical protein